MTRIWPLPKIDIMPLADLDEPRPVALVCTRSAWEAVRGQLRLRVAWTGEVLDAVEEHWQALLPEVHGEVVYAVGGGLAADAAKYLAAKRSLPLVCLPTALSVDAFLTWASGVRQAGCVRYLQTRPPDRLIADLDVIAAAPPAVRAAGICDVLSIATGCWDWALAERRGQTTRETRYIPYVAQAAQAILSGALDCAEAAGRGDPGGLRQLLDCLALEVQLCNQVGHARPEEGSEHYFAYAIENALGPGQPHGELVGPGIVLMAALQGQDVTPLQRALRACGVALNTLPASIVRETLETLPEYVRRHDLPHGIAHEIDTDLLDRLPSLD